MCIAAAGERIPYALVLPTGVAGQLVAEHERGMRVARFFAIGSSLITTDLELTGFNPPAFAKPGPAPDAPPASKSNPCTAAVQLDDRSVPELLALSLPPPTCSALPIVTERLRINAFELLTYVLTVACLFEMALLLLAYRRRGSTCPASAQLDPVGNAAMQQFASPCRLSSFVDACCSPITALATPSWLRHKQPVTAAADAGTAAPAMAPPSDAVGQGMLLQNWSR